MRTDLLILQRDLERIRKLDSGYLACPGASVHKYVLNPRLSERDVLLFEANHSINLPADYRDFLLTLGNGGAGPGYGLERLGHACGGAWTERPGIVGELALPFPYVDRWNEKPIDWTRPVDDQYRQQDEYWSSRHVTGAIPICDHGCGLRECLIVTGPERGNMWFDDRADWQGLYPDNRNDRDRLMFVEWYRAWIEECLLKAEPGQTKYTN